MKARHLLLTLFASTILFFDISAQQLPLVYDVENTGAAYPKPYLPTMNELPTITPLPDPFQWSDGRGRIQYFSDWEYRRNEIKAEIENYEIGIKPDRPDTITASYSNGTLTVNVTKNGKTLILTSAVSLPAGSGPFPAVIGMNSPSGSIPSTVFTTRNIARITFSHNQVTTYGNPSSSNPYYQLYPDLNPDNTGQYSAWVWGVSRIIDGLELVKDVLPIDLKHLAVTGCSYAGKMALFAGAFDERIALTIAQESGGGGATTWRYSEITNQTISVETLGKTDYNWFKNSMKDFSNIVSKLPEDHHELMAMVAPRALYVTANPDYTWLSNPSCYVASKAAKTVYDALGISERFGYGIVGGHGHCAVPDSQIPEIEAFVEKYLLGNNSANTNIATVPSNSDFTINFSSWITWTNPTITSGTSYYAKTTLAYPANLQKDLVKPVALKWNKINDAAKYIIQLSTSSSFSTVYKTDSTTTDTSISISNLDDGKQYYWRVQVKNSNGSAGPWSDMRSFYTYIDIPEKPQIVGFVPNPTRPEYVTLVWQKSKNADQYFVQLSELQTFSYLFSSATVTDTSRFFNGINEGVKYYWRVQALNVGGSSPWSDITNFVIIVAPTNLTAQKTGDKDITLNWTNNSSVNVGYIIERKQDQQNTFSVIDSSNGSGTTYVDKNVEGNINYTYRIKAYTDSGESDYSNETSIIIVGVEEIEGIPEEYSLSQNYPNPFNPNTLIKFGLPEAAQTKITIYNVLGKEMHVILSKQLSAGYYEVDFDASKLTSGVYFYSIQAGKFIQTKKMILMK